MFLFRWDHGMSLLLLSWSAVKSLLWILAVCLSLISRSVNSGDLRFNPLARWATGSITTLCFECLFYFSTMSQSILLQHSLTFSSQSQYLLLHSLVSTAKVWWVKKNMYIKEGRTQSSLKSKSLFLKLEQLNFLKQLRGGEQKQNKTASPFHKCYFHGTWRTTERTTADRQIKGSQWQSVLARIAYSSALSVLLLISLGSLTSLPIGNTRTRTCCATRHRRTLESGANVSH